MIFIEYKSIKEEAQDIVVNNAKVTYALALIPPVIYGIVSALSGDSIIMNIILLILSLMYPVIISVVFLSIVRQRHEYSFKQDIGQELKENGFRYIALTLLTTLFILLWSLLLIIPGLIKGFSYAMAPFIVKDHQEISPNQSITVSRQMMNGHKVRYLKLYFSYYKWILLSGLIGLAGLYIIIISFFSLLNGSVQTGLSPGTGIFLAVIGYLTMFILAIRILPRWYAAVAVFYEELKATHDFA